MSLHTARVVVPNIGSRLYVLAGAMRNTECLTYECSVSRSHGIRKPRAAPAQASMLQAHGDRYWRVQRAEGLGSAARRLSMLLVVGVIFRQTAPCRSYDVPVAVSVPQTCDRSIIAERFTRAQKGLLPGSLMS